MNLHAIVGGAISQVNPPVPATVQVSTGPVTLTGGKQVPGYATPGAITGSIADDVLTVATKTSGVLMAGQGLADLTSALVVGTKIVEQLTGPAGGLGTYRVDRSQTVTLEAMTTSLVLGAQVQALTFRDLQQVEGLNLQGTRRAIYLDGKIEGIVRADNKGGDLITITASPHKGTWLVAMVLETFGDGVLDGWTKVAATLQNS